MDQDEIESLRTAALPEAIGGADLRQRWHRVMDFQPVDRIPNFEFGYWAETLRKWRDQGLPDWVVDEAAAYRWFGIENWRWIWGHNVNTLMPKFTPETLADDGVHRTYRAEDGSVQRINVHGDQSIPQHLSFPLRDRRTWEEDFLPRLADNAERIPADFVTKVAGLRDRCDPMSINIGSMIGIPRNWIGFENTALMVHDDPKLLEDIVEHLCQLACAVLERALAHCDPDFGFGWEDICFNSGPITGVRFMRDVVAPRWKRVNDVLRRHGVRHSLTDCDGDIRPIIPALRDGGFDTLFPVEVHAGSDPLAIRDRFPDLRIQGGFDKMALLRGRPAIRQEIERLAPLVRLGGCLPGVDHRVQSDVMYEDYRHYLKLKRAILGAGGTPMYDEAQVG